MIIKCYLNQCGFCEDGWCMKPLVTIDENGMCNHIWFHGHQLSDAFRQVEHELPQIIEGEYEDVLEERECDGIINRSSTTADGDK